MDEDVETDMETDTDTDMRFDMFNSWKIRCQKSGDTVRLFAGSGRKETIKISRLPAKNNASENMILSGVFL